MASAGFVATDRLKSFLRFVVEETLDGGADRLKGYTIALEVLGRGARFDPQNDPVVCMEAGKLRRCLERYYLGLGRDDAIRIEIPKGTYVPVFVSRDDVERGRKGSWGPRFPAVSPAPLERWSDLSPGMSSRRE